MKFAIGIPTLNRMDLLVPALKQYTHVLYPNTKIFVWDNGNQCRGHIHDNIEYRESHNGNIGVAASWNKLCAIIFDRGFDAAMILNDDVVMGANENNILYVLKTSRAAHHISLVDWCAFIIKKTTFDKIEPFDENFFPAYYEDKDYEYRLKLSGLGLVRHASLAPSIYRNNSTGEKMPGLPAAAQKNREYYIRKWGGLPGKEIYKTPFNE